MRLRRRVVELETQIALDAKARASERSELESSAAALREELAKARAEPEPDRKARAEIQAEVKAIAEADKRKFAQALSDRVDRLIQTLQARSAKALSQRDATIEEVRSEAAAEKSELRADFRASLDARDSEIRKLQATVAELSERERKLKAAEVGRRRQVEAARVEWQQQLEAAEARRTETADALAQAQKRILALEAELESQRAANESERALRLNQETDASRQAVELKELIAHHNAQLSESLEQARREQRQQDRIETNQALVQLTSERDRACDELKRVKLQVMQAQGLAAYHERRGNALQARISREAPGGAGTQALGLDGPESGAVAGRIGARVIEQLSTDTARQLAVLRDAQEALRDENEQLMGALCTSVIEREGAAAIEALINGVHLELEKVHRALASDGEDRFETIFAANRQFLADVRKLASDLKTKHYLDRERRFQQARRGWAATETDLKQQLQEAQDMAKLQGAGSRAAGGGKDASPSKSPNDLYDELTAAHREIHELKVKVGSLFVQLEAERNRVPQGQQQRFQATKQALEERAAKLQSDLSATEARFKNVRAENLKLQRERAEHHKVHAHLEEKCQYLQAHIIELNKHYAESSPYPRRPSVVRGASSGPSPRRRGGGDYLMGLVRQQEKQVSRTLDAVSDVMSMQLQRQREANARRTFTPTSTPQSQREGAATLDGYLQSQRSSPATTIASGASPRRFAQPPVTDTRGSPQAQLSPARDGSRNGFLQDTLTSWATSEDEMREKLRELQVRAGSSSSLDAAAEVPATGSSPGSGVDGGANLRGSPRQSSTGALSPRTPRSKEVSRKLNALLYASGAAATPRQSSPRSGLDSESESASAILGGIDFR